MSMPMIPDAIEHAAPTRNANPVMTPIGRPASLGTSATSADLDDPDDDADDHRADDGEDRDGRVLAPDEGDRALVDRAGDVLHGRGPGVARQDVPREIDREQDRDDPGGQDDQLELTGVHQDRGSSTLADDRVPTRRVACAAWVRTTGECLPDPSW